MGTTKFNIFRFMPEFVPMSMFLIQDLHEIPNDSTIINDSIFSKIAEKTE